MTPADRPAGLETWICTHGLLLLSCQQIAARNHQVPAPLICKKDGSLLLMDVNPWQKGMLWSNSVHQAC